MFPKFKKPKKLIYLDHAAATPLDREVKKAMEPFLNEKFGNPSSLYQKGREAKQAIEEARKTIARLISAHPSEVVFTAGGTESVNLAIFGVARMNTNKETYKHGKHLIASAIEHHCILNSFTALEGEGHKTTLVNVDKEGFISIEKLKKAVKPETVLISIMYANNEIGTIEPIAEIGRWLKQINTERLQNRLTRLLFHTDACQAAGFLDLDVNRLGVDLMSVNGSKIYGPKQAGFLYVRSGVKLKPLIYGGGQENGLRSGTENVAGIVGLAKAFDLAQKHKNKETRRLFNLSGRLFKEIKKNIPNVLLNGPEIIVNHLKYPRYLNKTSRRLPNNINLTIQDVEGEALMFYLDSYGIAASTASACSTGSLDPSHVLLALGRNQTEAKSSMRFTLGKTTTEADINYLIKILPSLVKELRSVKTLN